MLPVFKRNVIAQGVQNKNEKQLWVYNFLAKDVPCFNSEVDGRS